MISKSQYELVIGLLYAVQSCRDFEDYLKTAIEIIRSSLNTISISAYKSIESRDRLVLVGELGGSFDQRISAFSSFSLMVRRAIKKKNLVYIPSHDADLGENDRSLAVLLPLTGGDEVVGLLGMIFDIGDYAKHRANSLFYSLLGRVVGTAGILKSQVAACQRIEKFNPDQAYSERIASLGVLASGISHEFNNILAVIKGYAELLGMKGTEGGKFNEAIRVIDDQTERGARIIESLNVFVKGNAGKLEYHALDDIAGEIAGPLHRTLQERGIELSFDCRSCPRVLVDRAQIKEAVLSVLQYSIESLEGVPSGFIEIATGLLDGRPSLRIRDNGAVMSSEQVDMAIHPFLTREGEIYPDICKRGGQGAGLRLAIAHGIMRSHGGSILINSVPDGGKEVRLVFYRIELGEEKPVRYEEGEVVYFGDTRILIVDDEAPIREFLTRAFDDSGYQVMAVGSGQEAIEICSFEDIDIVFLDYLMPGPKGDEVFNVIKRISPSTDIVFITGVDEIPDINRLLNEGLCCVLKKPFKIEKILNTTSDIIQKRIARTAM